ncbi:MAG: S46 family peptidase [Bacteroidetes bacterium]|nr:S46 family peptidase [Bacteroidota bacterium]
MIKIKLLLVFVISFFIFSASANEGMWIPLLLQQLNEEEMQDMGMKMSAEDIYSVNKSSLKDAIVQFGGGCTASVISSQGLLLTNWHCGRGRIQSHSSVENDYLKNGFWAKSLSEELPNPKRLTVTFIVRIEDVTEAALNGVTDKMNPRQRQSKIDQNLNQLRMNAPHAAHEAISIRPFFKGNQYFLFVTSTYRDVRLVGTPPQAIGEFGKDTDNWVWPRHTGDFSLFRIYADENNLPADYSPDNVPYQPKHYLPVSLKGVEEGDFTLVFGFPGRTNEYLPAVAVDQTVNIVRPVQIEIRDKVLEIMDAEMQKDQKTRIQYTSKQSGVANAWKKWKGEVMGVKATNGIGRKKKLEATFQERVDVNPEFKKQYGTILKEFDDLYTELEPYVKTQTYFNEIVLRHIEVFRLASYFSRQLHAYESSGESYLESRKASILSYLKNFQKNYQSMVDEKVFAALMEIYIRNVDQRYLSELPFQLLQESDNDFQKFAKNIFKKSKLTQLEELFENFEENPGETMESIKGDVILHLASGLAEKYYENIEGNYNEINGKITELQRIYMQAQMDVFPEKRFFPDANSTLRVTYGKVEGYTPKDGVQYLPKTYLSGVLEKYKPGDYEFDVPAKLIELYETKDYGKYGENGKMPVCLVGSNHTSGGNSGSPAVDAEGNLIGLNFDRVWEGTMSDINYDPSICRNIMVDIRYVLFLIDKFSGADHIVKELKLVE